MEAMAIASNTVSMIGRITKNTSFKLEKGVLEIQFVRQGNFCNALKLKTKVSNGVKSMVQVGLEESSSVSNLKGLEESLKLDVVSERELREKGFLGLRKTKLVCTIGPACCSLEDLEKLALGGMNVARLNMCHNTREWHKDVIRKLKRLNEERGFCVSVMIDTEGSQIHVVDHGAPSSVKAEVQKLLPFQLF